MGSLRKVDDDDGIAGGVLISEIVCFLRAEQSSRWSEIIGYCTATIPPAKKLYRDIDDGWVSSNMYDKCMDYTQSEDCTCRWGRSGADEDNRFSNCFYIIILGFYIIHHLQRFDNCLIAITHYY